MESSPVAQRAQPWNKGKLVGQKAPLELVAYSVVNLSRSWARLVIRHLDGIHTILRMSAGLIAGIREVLDLAAAAWPAPVAAPASPLCRHFG